MSSWVIVLSELHLDPEDPASDCKPGRHIVTISSLDQLIELHSFKDLPDPPSSPLPSQWTEEERKIKAMYSEWIRCLRAVEYLLSGELKDGSFQVSGNYIAQLKRVNKDTGES